MKVEVDSQSGFCFGVVNAISVATATADEMRSEEGIRGEGPVSLGDIVHNGAEMARLEALGLEVAPEGSDLASLAGRTVLIRAHGEPPETYEQAREYGIRLVDATCPVVARLQATTRNAHDMMGRMGGRVVIFGRRGHAEVRGLAGQVGGDVTVVENEGDLDALDFRRPIYFLAQTTSSLDVFRRLGDEIKRRSAVARQVHRVASEMVAGSYETREAVAKALVNTRTIRADGTEPVTVHDTICRQVSGREEHLAEFARRFDVVIFVSGAKSSNGRVLFEAVRGANRRSYKIENAAELRPEWFTGGGDATGEGNATGGSGQRATSVGVCGATSTPGWLMNEIAETIPNIT